MAATQTEYQTGFAADIAPYGKAVLGKAEALTSTPYEAYTGQRVAGLSALQQQAINQAAALGYDPRSLAASLGMQNLAQRASSYGYTPSSFDYLTASAPSLNQYQMAGPANVAAQQAMAAQLSAAPQASAAQFAGPSAISYNPVTGERVSAPSLRDLQMQAAGNVAARNVQAGTIQAAQMEPAQQVSTGAFTAPGTVKAYMSPYQQAVTDIAKREAQRQADIAGTQRGARQAQSGAFGGSRAAIENAEAQRNLSQQMADIQAKGSQEAYNQAAQMFTSDQARQLAAQQANQQAGLTVGMQNLTAQQQANVQNVANQLQASGMNAQSALQAALANQGVQQQANLQNLSAALQTQGLGAQTGLTAQQLNQANALQAGLANQQAGLTAEQFNATTAYNTALQNAQLQQQAALANQGLMGQYGLQQGQFQQAANMQNPQFALQAALANQQMGYNVGNQNLQALLGTQQLGASQNLQAQLANQAANQQMQQLAEQSKQYGAGLGLQGLQAGMQGYNQLGALGQNLYGQNIGNIGLQQQLGGVQQQTDQATRQAAYEDFLRRQQYPYQQLAFMSDMVRGAPLTQQSSTIFTPNPSLISQIGGLATAGMGAYGLYNQAFGGPPKAAGGTVKNYAKGGLVKADRKPAGLSAIVISRIG